MQHTTNVPIIYFGTDSTTLLPSMRETGAEVIGLDWRVPLDEGWKILDHKVAVQGNLDPVLLFADVAGTEGACGSDLEPGQRTSRPHLQSWSRHSSQTPVQNVKDLAKFVHEYSSTLVNSR